MFRFDGIKLFSEAIEAGTELVYVICRDSCDVGIMQKVREAIDGGAVDESKTVVVSESVFDKISEERAPEGIICVAKMNDGIHFASEEAPEGRIFILESVRDPGNLGTIMRSAYALGIDTLVLTDDCADIYNPKTIRAAMGAVFKMRTQTVSVGALPRFIGKLRESGRRVWAAALEENSRKIGDICLRDGDCFVVGNEGHGLSCDTVSACDASVIIPMREGAESLNAAGAAVICIWETVRI